MIRFLITILCILLPQVSWSQDYYSRLTQHIKTEEYARAIALYEENHTWFESLKGDSLIWVQFRYARSLLNTGRTAEAEKVSSLFMNRVSAIEDRDLRLRIHLFYGYLLIHKTPPNYGQAIREFDNLETLINPLIAKYEMDQDTLRLQYALEMLTKATINKSLGYYYLGEIEKYGELSARAIELSRKNMAIAQTNYPYTQHLIASRNYIEFLEMHQRWDEVIIHLQEYGEKLTAYADQLNYTPGQVSIEAARYKVRQAVYLKDKANDYPAAIRLLEEATTTAVEYYHADIFEDAFYQLFNAYYQSGDNANAQLWLQKYLYHPIITENISALARLKARTLEFYVITGNVKEATLEYEEIQAMDTAHLDPESEVIITHALIMYLTSTDQAYTARLLLSDLLNDQLHKTTPDQTNWIGASIYQLYTEYKYQHDEPRTHAEVVQQLIRAYERKEVTEWMFKKSETPPLQFWVLGGIGIAAIVYFGYVLKGPAKITITGSPAFQELSATINNA